MTTHDTRWAVGRGNGKGGEWGRERGGLRSGRDRGENSLTAPITRSPKKKMKIARKSYVGARNVVAQRRKAKITFREYSHRDETRENRMTGREGEEERKNSDNSRAVSPS